MSEIFITIHPRDSIVSRDGRPFGAGQGRRMKPLDWPLPSTVAGSLRTVVVKATPDLQFDGPTKQALKGLEVAGVLPFHAGQLYLPVPNDCVVKEQADRTLQPLRARPQRGWTERDGCDLPAGLLPVMLSFQQADEGFKPTPPPAWWPLGKLVEWLTLAGDAEPAAGWFDESFLGRPEKELRDHVCIDSGRGAAAESLIYQSASVRVGMLPRAVGGKGTKLSDRFVAVSLLTRVRNGSSGFKHLQQLSRWHPLGGERRLVHWQASADAGQPWRCPDAVRRVLGGNTRNVRMLLASPAIFRDGWKPGWLSSSADGTLQGKPPIENAPTLKLVAVSVPRWRAVSGWSYEPVEDPDGLGQTKPGPKPIRRMAPAGAVYFFEVVEGNPAALAEHGWLEPVSDDEQERRDGFGLAAWGVW